jgi:hypothetical protein
LKINYKPYPNKFNPEYNNFKIESKCIGMESNKWMNKLGNNSINKNKFSKIVKKLSINFKKEPLM